MDSTALHAFAARYASAWSSQEPQRVAACFSEGGSLSVNDGAPAVGRPAITEVARGFMTDFPDMVVSADDAASRAGGAIFRWTLSGTHAGTGQRVRISGFEDWTFGPDELVARSLGRYDAADYARQVAHGVDG